MLAEFHIALDLQRFDDAKTICDFVTIIDQAFQRVHSEPELSLRSQVELDRTHVLRVALFKTRQEDVLVDSAVWKP